MPNLLGEFLNGLRGLFAGSESQGHSTVGEQAAIKCSYAIPVTDEMREAEWRDIDEVMNLLQIAIRDSGIFRDEMIPELMAKLRSESAPFTRVNTRVAFEGDYILSVEEKRALGLNTRMKYSKAFIEYFNPSILKTIEPKSTLENMHLNAVNRVARKRDLRRFKEMGFVKQVRIVPIGDGQDCERIKRFKKIHNLADAPELPLPGSSAPFCLCMYKPILPDKL
jgi:hypothetical protein